MSQDCRRRRIIFIRPTVPLTCITIYGCGLKVLVLRLQFPYAALPDVRRGRATDGAFTRLNVVAARFLDGTNFYKKKKKTIIRVYSIFTKIISRQRDKAIYNVLKQNEKRRNINLFRIALYTCHKFLFISVKLYGQNYRLILTAGLIT